MIPAEFSEKMQRLLGTEYPAFLASLDRPLQKGIRLSAHKGADPAALPFVEQPIPWAARGYTCNGSARPGKHPWHEAGAYYLQEPSAMAPAGLLEPQPGERVLDLCAAPGGKSTQLADLLNGTGLLVCNEINTKRAKILSRNIERMGIANALVLNMFPKELEKTFAGFFDRVLVDAPCSGEGMFRKEEAAGDDWSQATVEMCAARQAEILDTAAKLLRSGGTLVYSTCTFAPEEDEGSIAGFLARHPDFSVIRPAAADEVWASPGRPEWADGNPALADTIRLWPHVSGGEGHFAALLRKCGDTPGSYLPAAEETAMPPELREFLDSMAITLPEGRLIRFGQSYYLAPDGLPDLHGLKVLRPGLELGRLVSGHADAGEAPSRSGRQGKPGKAGKCAAAGARSQSGRSGRPVISSGRFEPAHALAIWLKTAAVTADFPADSPEILSYLHGGILPGSQQGWTLVTADGLSLGWAKGSGGQLKNHFPKGLRWL